MSWQLLNRLTKVSIEKGKNSMTFLFTNVLQSLIATHEVKKEDNKDYWALLEFHEISENVKDPP